MLRRAQLVLAAATAQYFVPAPGAPGALPGAIPRGPGAAVFSPAGTPLRVQDAALRHERHVVAPDERRRPGAALAGALLVGAAAAALRGGRPAMQADGEEADGAADGAVELIEKGEPEPEEAAPAAAAMVPTLSTAELIETGALNPALGIGLMASGNAVRLPGSGPTIGVAPDSSLDKYIGVSEEFGNRVWDPLGFGGFVGDNTMRWFRHAELKHGRVCMLAFVGWCIQESGSHWAGYFDLEQTVSFASVSKLDFYESWYAVPPQGRLQIITLIGWIEWVCECTNPNGHYTKNGIPGDLSYLRGPGGFPVTLGIPKGKEAEFELAELKHGRLAMIAMASIFAYKALPGSVPALSALQQYGIIS